MLEETPVLGGDKGLHDVFRDFIVGHRDSFSLADLTDQVAIATEDAQWHLQTGFCGRKAGLHIVISANNTGNGGDGSN